MSERDNFIINKTLIASKNPRHFISSMKEANPVSTIDFPLMLSPFLVPAPAAQPVG